MPNNLTDYEENRLLDLSLLNTDKLALMSTQGTDSSAGTEVTGGSYGRITLTFASAASGSKATSAGVNFTALPATDVQGWAIYESAGTNRKWYGLFSPRNATAQNTGDTITDNSHGRSNGDEVVFLTGYAPTGLSANTTYFVVGSTTNTFQVSATLGGSAIAITADSALAVYGLVLSIASGAGISVASGALTCSLS